MANNQVLLAEHWKQVFKARRDAYRVIDQHDPKYWFQIPLTTR